MTSIFMLHPGIGSIRPYWELIDNEDDPLVIRARKGEVEKAGIVVALPRLPHGWMPGRYFASFPDCIGAGKYKWKEITGQVEIDEEKGIQDCPSYLQYKYTKIALTEDKQSPKEAK